jgi:uncharacterized protein YciI
MKTIFISLFLTLPFLGFTQTQEEIDAMGLKQYIFVMYTKGDVRSQDSATAMKIQTQHLNHLDSLAGIGVLNVAGPFLEEHNWRGLLIFDVKTKEEAESYVKKDPAVKAGRLKYIILPWMTKKGVSFK